MPRLVHYGAKNTDIHPYEYMVFVWSKSEVPFYQKAGYRVFGIYDVTPCAGAVAPQVEPPMYRTLAEDTELQTKP